MEDRRYNARGRAWTEIIWYPAKLQRSKCTTTNNWIADVSSTTYRHTTLSTALCLQDHDALLCEVRYFFPNKTRVELEITILVVEQRWSIIEIITQRRSVCPVISSNIAFFVTLEARKSPHISIITYYSTPDYNLQVGNLSESSFKMVDTKMSTPCLDTMIIDML